MIDPQLLFGAAAIVTSIAALVSAFRIDRSGTTRSAKAGRG